MITQEQFDIMKYEIMECNPSKHEMLYEIASECLTKQISIWCNRNPILKGRQEEWDIFSATFMRMMTRIKTNFFANEGRYGEGNNEIARLVGWMKAVAYSIYVDKSNEVGGGKNVFIDSYEEKIEKTGSEVGEEEIYYMERPEIALLQEALDTIVAGKANIYKILAWLSVYIYMLVYDIGKIEANRNIEKDLSSFTLYGVYSLIEELSSKISWLTFSQVHKDKIEAELNKPYDETRKFAEVELENFYMAKGARESLSDWWNKMNDIFRRRRKNDGK